LSDGVLVIGYGNPLRTDDGIGWHAAERLAIDPRLDGVTVVQRHQLTPELALDVSQAALVVLVDASRDQPAGTFLIDLVQRADRTTTQLTHRFDPSSLVGLADDLYGHAPDIFAVSVGVESLELGDRLSPLLEAALPRVVDAVVELVASRTGNEPIAGRSRA
jgi:hydrogenase maturation protease